jgi:hypothetical protein
MNEKFEKQDRSPALEAFRDELGEEFVRAARSQPGSPLSRRLRRGGLAVLAAAIVVPGAIAAASELGGSPARVLVPMSAPADSPDSTSGPACPQQTRDLFFEVAAGEKTVSDYREAPGYPVANCPSAEDLQQLLQDNGSTLQQAGSK